MPKFHCKVLFSGLLLVAILAGCGQKGPLYLPKSPASPPVSDAAPPRP